MAKIAYLAPEIPALSATFVYEEINALRSLGVQVFSFSVRKPVAMAKDENYLIENTEYLYSINPIIQLTIGCVKSMKLPGRKRALRWLFRDIVSTGIFGKNSLKLLYQFSAAAIFSEKLIKNNIDHLHIHFAHVPTQIGMYASALSNVKFTVTAHANDIFQRGLLLKEKAERSAGFFTISEYNKNFLSSLGVDDRKLKVVRCGYAFADIIDLPKINNKSGYKLGVLGRLVEKKGIDVLVLAIRSLLDHGLAVDLYIAGNGPLRHDLEALVEHENLKENVVFLGGISHSDVPAFFDSLDLFVLPCKKDENGDMDGIPVVLMEAMARGVPVISTKISGIPELVIDGETGLLAKPGDVSDLADKIRASLTLVPATRKRQEKAIKHVREEFSQSSNVKKLLDYWAGINRGN